MRRCGLIVALGCLGAADCGPGCFSLPAPAPVRAMALGVVVGTAPLRIAHRWLENADPQEAVFTYQGVEGGRAVGERIPSGAALGQATRAGGWSVEYSLEVRVPNHGTKRCWTLERSGWWRAKKGDRVYLYRRNPLVHFDCRF